MKFFKPSPPMRRIELRPDPLKSLAMMQKNSAAGSKQRSSWNFFHGLAIASLLLIVSLSLILTQRQDQDRRAAPARNDLPRRLSSSDSLRGTDNSSASPEMRQALSTAVLSSVLPGKIRLEAGENPLSSLMAYLLDPLQPLKIRRDAAWQIAKIGSDEALTVLRQALLNAPPLLKATIAEALGHSKNSQAGALIAALLRDSDEVVIRGAIRGLAAIGDDQSVKLIAEIMRDSRRHSDLRTAAAIALGQVNDPAANQLLIQLAQGTQDREILTAALTGLGQQSFNQTEKFFRSFLASNNVGAEMRALALEALGQGTRDAAPLILGFLQADESTVRAAAAWAIANLDEAGTVAPPLINQLSREAEPEVRTRIYQALANQESMDASRLLPVVLNDGDPTAQVAGFNLLAARVGLGNDPWLAGQFDELVIPRLAGLAIDGKDLTTRLSAVIALRQARTNEAMQTLAAIAARSGDAKVVQAANMK
jgi:HEAT repeat protein